MFNFFKSSFPLQISKRDTQVLSKFEFFWFSICSVSHSRNVVSGTMLHPFVLFIESGNSNCDESYKRPEKIPLFLEMT